MIAIFDLSNLNLFVKLNVLFVFNVFIKLKEIRIVIKKIKSDFIVFTLLLLIDF